MALERLFVATRAVLGTLRYASLEASPLLASGALEPLLVELSVSMMTGGAPPCGAGDGRSEAVLAVAIYR